MTKGKGGALTRRNGDGQQLRKARAGSWTSAKRARFLAELAATANVRASAAAVGMCPQGAYQLRTRNAVFRAGWTRALAEGFVRLELMLLERALTGEEMMRTAAEGAGDDVLDRLMRYPNSLALALYKAHRPSAELAEEADDEAAAEAARARVKAKLAALALRLEREKARGDGQ